jgi:DNA polymerase-1
MSSLMPKLLEKPRFTWYKQGQRTVSTAPSVFSEQLNIKTKALEFICDMEIVGMQYDIEGNRAMDRRMVEDLAETEDQIFTAIGKRIDLSSSAVLKDFLYREKGFEAPLQTKHGDDSTSGDALMALHKIHQLPWLEAIKKRNDVFAMHGNFIKTYIEDWVKSDGRVHPSYNLHGTSSHRISSSEPNLLNLPRGYYGYNIRQLYTAKPGYIFLAFDFSSCEVKILAALSGDETMIEACVSGKDFHSYTASMIYHIDYDEFVAIVKDHHHPDHKKFKNYRQGAKSVTFVMEA